MAVPFQVDDGSKLRAYQVGADRVITPFSDRGDFLSFEIVRTYRVDQAQYRRAKKMDQLKTRFGTAYLVEEGEAEPIGQGLVEFKRTFASVPVKRFEGTSIIYSIQFYSESASYDWEIPPPEPTITEVPVNMNAEVVYEYFIGRPLALIAPKIQIINGSLFNFGGFGNFTYGQTVLAEDSTVEIYKAGIYVRRSVYIKWPVRSNV